MPVEGKWLVLVGLGMGLGGTVAGFALARRRELPPSPPKAETPTSVVYPAEEIGHVYRLTWGSKYSRRRRDADETPRSGHLVLIDSPVLHDLRASASTWRKVESDGISLVIPRQASSEEDEGAGNQYWFMPWQGTGNLPNQIGKLYELKPASRDEKPNKTAARLLHLTRGLVRDKMADDVPLNWFLNEAGGV